LNNLNNKIMTLAEIKTAVQEGKKVHWSNSLYTVEYDNYTKDYNIICTNGYCIGLTWRDGITMNGKEEDFYIEPDLEPAQTNK